MRRGLPADSDGGWVGGDPPLVFSGWRQVTADQFESLDDLEAEAWIAGRFSEFVRHGFPPDLSLLFAVHPEVASFMRPLGSKRMCESFET
jgi:hypothetical protein